MEEYLNSDLIAISETNLPNALYHNSRAYIYIDVNNCHEVPVKRENGFMTWSPRIESHVNVLVSAK